MTHAKRHRNRHPRDAQETSLTYVALATLCLISCVAMSVALVGVGHAQTEPRTATTADPTHLVGHHTARTTPPHHRIPMSAREAEYVSNAPSHGDRFGFKF